jgi:hypothetical protein
MNGPLPGTTGAARSGSEGEGTVRTFTGDEVRFEVGEEGNQWRRIDDLTDPERDPTESLTVRGDDESQTDAERESQVVIERRSENDRRVITVRAGGADHLSVSFRDECWLEVSDRSGTTVYQDLNRSGDLVDLFGQAPFRILVGRAQSVTILFNDQPVDLVPDMHNNTAKVELGT